jgi:FtsZ-binding cell division protein ZapB
MTTFVAEKTLPIDVVRIDGGTQSRCSINEEKVYEYAEAMTEGDAFPPAVAFFDGREYWLADGFHRYHATLKNKKQSFVCRIINGTVRDAILYSFKANGMHGMPMSNEDKRRIVLEMLNDFEWMSWSDREIARQCCVSHVFVSKLRNSMDTPQPEVVKHKTADGKIVERERKERKPKKTSAAGNVTIAVAEVTDKHDEKQEAIEFLIEENDKLKAQLAVATADDPEFTKNMIDDLQAELKQTKIELSAVIKSRDMYQSECSQLKKQVASYQRQMRKAA